eukprot:TRINITY_DN26898_c0_g1_i1.p1 TRINITY_DN26898_c0_g1~~TRINITY_DN26898_c0_g1_i1.p1  ORF type:complete len:107 (+),score=24.51 TRINITY_DN26898_c0_g1_i1:16-336(+)
MSSLVNLDERIQLIQSKGKVEAVVVVENAEKGRVQKVVRTTVSQEQTTKIVNDLIPFLQQSQSLVKRRDEQDELGLVRLRSKKREVMIIPDPSFVMIVIHCPTETS